MEVQNGRRDYKKEGRKDPGVIIQDIMTPERHIYLLFVSA